MKKITIFLLLFFTTIIVQAQVGINTTIPNAQLDIRSSNQAAPTNTDGILIPKVDAFPATNPTAAQQGMLVYLTTAAGADLPGFYYWDNTTVDWIPIAGNSGVTLDQAYDFGGAGLGRTITADTGAVTIDGTDGLVSTGTIGTGALAPTGAGVRMVWNPRKAAFRAGSIAGTEWDDNNIGFYSVAFGFDTRARGVNSTAFGNSTLASGLLSSTAFGSFTTASGMRSTAFGNSTLASGTGSTAFGNSTNANGNLSTAFGSDNVASSFAETVLGIGATTYLPSINGTTQFRTANATDRLFVIGNAIDANNNTVVDTAERSDAMIVLKNGLTRLPSTTNAMITAADGKAVVTKEYLQSTTSGTLDQAYDFGGAGLGRTITADTGAVTIDGTDGLVSTGTIGTGALAPTGAGDRMVWNPRKGAFRAGNSAGNEWDDANLGDYSTAFGANNTASGNYSFATGIGSTVSGISSFGAGFNTVASGNIATAFGYETQASGQGAVAFGTNTDATGYYATSFGSGTTASGIYSTSFGQSTTASAQGSVAFGNQTVANGDYSAVFGQQASASGLASFSSGQNTGANAPYSTAFGYWSGSSGESSFVAGRNSAATGYTSVCFGESNFALGSNASVLGFNGTAVSFGETVLGIGASTYTPSTNGNTQFRTANATDRLFVIGNAIDSNNNNVVDVAERSDAMVILKNGNTGFGTSTPAVNFELRKPSPVFRVAANDNNSSFLQLYEMTAGLPYGYMFEYDGNLDKLYLHSKGFAGNDGIRMTWLKTGNVGIGTFNPNGQFELSLDQGRKPGTNTWTIVSDQRLKTINGNYTKGLNEILQLNPIRFNYKNVGERTFEKEVLDREFAGFIAQEVQPLFPDAIGTDADGFFNFNIHPILVASINAIKELNAKNESLQEENQLLKQQIESLLVQQKNQESINTLIIERLAALETKN